ncbi:hypothetical protein E2C01_029352 [Portunus trituberculatus]|uniref:Uncharacterized protein n=1 Tax=Portunus trituberculatus TaxID=210409 RepID=A0A5B7ER89_PORTR|nr:hypothetical protein [Portunus trituberculatus]
MTEGSPAALQVSKDCRLSYIRCEDGDDKVSHGCRELLPWNADKEVCGGGPRLAQKIQRCLNAVVIKFP